MAQKKPRLTRHHRKILGVKKTTIKKVNPGDIMMFRYTKAALDPMPLVMVLYLEDNRLLHCINLNYLPETEVQKLFRGLVSRYGLEEKEEKNNKGKVEKHSKISMPGNAGLMSPIGKEIYSQIVKPKIMQNTNCYRTYDIRLISGAQKIRYEMDIVKSGMSRMSAQEVDDRKQAAIESKMGIKSDKQGK